MPRAKAPRKTCQECGRRLTTVAERLSKFCWDGEGVPSTRLCALRAALRLERRVNRVAMAFMRGNPFAVEVMKTIAALRRAGRRTK